MKMKIEEQNEKKPCLSVFSGNIYGGTFNTGSKLK